MNSVRCCYRPNPAIALGSNRRSLALVQHCWNERWSGHTHTRERGCYLARALLWAWASGWPQPDQLQTAELHRCLSVNKQPSACRQRCETYPRPLVISRHMLMAFETPYRTISGQVHIAQWILRPFVLRSMDGQERTRHWPPGRSPLINRSPLAARVWHQFDVVEHRQVEANNHCTNHAAHHHGKERLQQRGEIVYSHLDFLIVEFGDLLEHPV